MTKRKPGRPRRGWAEVALDALQSTEGPTRLVYIYDDVRWYWPVHVTANPHWKDKIRQALQRLRGGGHAENVSNGMGTATRSKSD